MKNWFVFCCLTLVITACAANEQDQAASPPPGIADIDRGEGLSDTFEDGVQTDEEQLVEAREQDLLDLDGGESYTTVEAERLVRRHLNIDESSDTIVAFNREENDKYIINVYHLGEDREKEPDLTGSYIVDPTTGKIQDPHKNRK